MSFAVAEKFVSINGESIRAGEPAVFIRFAGCNLNCSYCDTKWANCSDTPVTMMSAEEITDYADSTRIRNITLTGGEPLLRENMAELISMLIKHGHTVEIETNGSIDIKEFSHLPERPFFTLDYKLPGSGMEKYMLTDNYNYLKYGDAVKFVVSDKGDLERAHEIIEGFSLTEKCSVYLSPVFGRIDAEEIVNYMLEKKMNNVRLQLQLHKYIWDPNKRGV